MDSTKQNGLAYLPDVVYTEGLLPLLSVNEVFRLRRVCKSLKSICDDHLRKKCPSESIVRLQQSSSRKESKDIFIDSLSNFLKFDSTSSIRIPSRHFYLDIGSSIDHLSLNFSRIYGAQIRHLTIDKMKLPFVSNSSQFQFFQNLTNLSSLTVDDIYTIDVNDANREIVPESLPTCFRNSIRKFEASSLCLRRVSDEDIFWKTMRLFENLEYFQFPRYSIEAQCSDLENCCKLIGTESSNIKCFDLRNMDDVERSEESLKFFSEESLRNKIKWENVPAWILGEPLYTTAWMPNTDLIASMSRFSSQDANEEGLSFPNLVSLEVFNMSCGLPLQIRKLNLGPNWSHIPRVLSPSIYPALRILKVTGMITSDNLYFSEAWQYLTNLEVLSFHFENIGDMSMRLSSKTFLGHDETQEPPLLRLKKLKKLSIHIPRDQNRARSIHDAFHKAFRLIPLKEFNITSDCAIRSVIFDKDAILALCSPGPFIENIEKFSFRNWSMEDVTDDEFRQLGRKFPNNQAL